MDETYIELCEMLTLKNINDHESCKGWTVMKGRYQVFEHFLPILESLGWNIKLKNENGRDYLKCFKGMVAELGGIEEKLEGWQAGKLSNLSKNNFLKIEKNEDLMNRSLADSDLGEILSHRITKDSTITSNLNQSPQKEDEDFNQIEDLKTDFYDLKIIKKSKNDLSKIT